MMGGIPPNLSLLENLNLQDLDACKSFLLTILFGTTSIDIYLSWKATIAVLTG